MEMNHKGISAISLALVALFSGTATAGSLDNHCDDLGRAGFRSLDVCEASEAHYKGQASRLKTWATSDQWAKCENYSWSHRSMARCLQRELGNRGPGLKTWTPPPSKPIDRDTERSRSQPRQSVSPAAAPSPSNRAQRQYADAQPSGSSSPSRAPVSMGRPTPASTTFRGAAQAGDVASLEVYLANGQDIDAPLADGKTALHYAAMWGREEAVEFLLSRGADHHVADDSGRTPLFYAKERRYREIEELLKDPARR